MGEGISMRVNAKSFWVACKNSSLYAREKSWNGGEVAISFDRESQTVSVASCDDFVGLTTSVGVEVAETKTYFVPARDLKDMEKVLRDQTGEIELDFSEMSTEPKEPEWWDGFEYALDNLGSIPEALPTWEVNPERLALLNRLEPKGQYPLSVRSCSIHGEPLLAWKYGPRTAGLIVPLDRAEMELEDAEVVLWS
jgi:hypothetical protein